MPAHPRGLMGLIAPSFLGTRGTRCSSRAHPFASRLGVTQVNQGLALSYIYYTNICLEHETTLGSPGASPATLTPGGGGGNPLIARPTGEYLFEYSTHLFY